MLQRVSRKIVCLLGNYKNRDRNTQAKKKESSTTKDTFLKETVDQLLLERKLSSRKFIYFTHQNQYMKNK